MRFISILAASGLLAVSVGLVGVGGLWVYPGLFCAALGGAALVFSGVLGVYYGDHDALDKASS